MYGGNIFAFSRDVTSRFTTHVSASLSMEVNKEIGLYLLIVFLFTPGFGMKMSLLIIIFLPWHFPLSIELLIAWQKRRGQIECKNNKRRPVQPSAPGAAFALTFFVARQTSCMEIFLLKVSLSVALTRPNFPKIGLTKS